jgi:hypothetical protein
MALGDHLAIIVPEHASSERAWHLGKEMASENEHGQ